MKRIFVLIASALVFSAAAFAEGSVAVHGFIRNYYAFDTRETVAGTEDFFLYLPKDRNLNADGEDLNAIPSFRFAAITSRLWVEAAGYQFGGLNVGARVEADFYAGLTGNTGTAQLRLRQAFVTFGKESWSIKAGQAWHPLAADLADVISLNSGMPCGPFSRTPQVTLDWNISKNWGITASALWQMQYCSTGPSGKSANYMKYGCTPEFYAGVNLKAGGALLRLGVDILSLKPRNFDSTGKHRVKDRITTMSPFFYAQYKTGLFSAKFKTVFAQAGDHINLNGGYGVSAINEDGSWAYTPTRNLSSWLSLVYGKKLQVTLFGGYVRNFGTIEPLLEYEDNPGYAKSSDLYFSGNSFSNMNRLWRATPGIVYNIGKLAFGLECELTGAQFGDYNVYKYTDTDGKEQKVNCIPAENGLCTDNLHWVTNCRVLGMIKFTF